MRTASPFAPAAPHFAFEPGGLIVNSPGRSPRTRPHIALNPVGVRVASDDQRHRAIPQIPSPCHYLAIWPFAQPCSYNRDGLPPAAPCPECSSSPVPNGGGGRVRGAGGGVSECARTRRMPPRASRVVLALSHMRINRSKKKMLWRTYLGGLKG